MSLPAALNGPLTPLPESVLGLPFMSLAAAGSMASRRYGKCTSPPVTAALQRGTAKSTSSAVKFGPIGGGYLNCLKAELHRPLLGLDEVPRILALGAGEGHVLDGLRTDRHTERTAYPRPDSGQGTCTVFLPRRRIQKMNEGRAPG